VTEDIVMGSESMDHSAPAGPVSERVSEAVSEGGNESKSETVSEGVSERVSECAPPLRHVDLIGVLGKRRVFSILDSSGTPHSNITHLQHVAGLGFPSLPHSLTPSHTSLPFLDLLQVPRAVVYQHLFSAAKCRLSECVRGLQHWQLVKMLSETIPYLGVAELKCVPLDIIKKLSHQVPEKYLLFIAKNCQQSFILEDIPVEVCVCECV
jgi:hypothetical protein